MKGQLEMNRQRRGQWRGWKKPAWACGAAVLAAATMVAGCSTSNGSGSNGGNGTGGGGAASNKPITIGVVTTLTGALAAYGQEWQRGFKIGLEYATNGTNAVDGHPLNVVWKDDNNQPNQAVTDAKSLFTSDHIDILAGGVNSASAIAMEPLAQRYKTVYVVGPAVADSITGADYNPYIFKVSPNSYMEAKAAVLSIPDQHATVAQLTPNYAFGWDSVKAFKALATQAGMKDVLRRRDCRLRARSGPRADVGTSLCVADARIRGPVQPSDGDADLSDV